MHVTRLGTAVGLAVGFLCLAGDSARAAEDAKTLRQQALALNRLTGNDPVNGQFKVLVDDAKSSRRLLQVARAMVKEKPQPFNYNAAYIFAHLAEEHKDFDAGAAFYRACIDQAARLQSARKLSLAFINLISLYYDNQKYDDAVRVCREFLEFKTGQAKPRLYLLAADSDEGDEPDFLELESYDPVRLAKAPVHRLLVQAIAKQGKFDEALKLADRLSKSRPKDWLDYQLKGWVYREAGKYQQAAKVYENVIDQVRRDKELEAEEKDRYVERYRYVLSNIYVELNQLDKATAALRALLAKKPDDSTYNNDLGYIMADHNLNLEEAEKLIRKALEIDRKKRKEAKVKPEDDRDNGAYLDSLGWVLYKQKKYKEAREVLLQAVADKENQHIEIFDHLGDIHMALGEKDKAIAAWKKGLEFVTPVKRDQERKAAVEKKIKAAE
jgi:Flp pilus assembly protein TadD